MNKIFYKKLKKRAITELKKIIPFNLKYRPKGIYNEIQSINSNQDLKVHPVYSNYRIELPIPKGLSEYFAPYTSFDEQIPGSKIYTENDYLVAELPGGRISSDNNTYVAAISRDNKVVKEVSYFARSTENKTKDSYGSFNKKLFFENLKYFKGTVFNMLIGGGGIGNYFHWFVDILPRIYLLEKCDLDHKIDYYLVPQFSIDYQLDSVDILGIDRSKIIVADEKTHLTADNIISTSYVRGSLSNLIPGWVNEFNRRMFLDFTLEKLVGKPKKKHIYISRKDSKRRSIPNEDELINLLVKYDFNIIELSKYSFIEKVKLFNDAEFIISPHGAGLTNLMFCQQGCRLLEMYPPSFVIPDLYNIGYHQQINYKYLICLGEKKANTYKEAMLKPYWYDIKAIEKEIASFLSQTNLTH